MDKAKRVADDLRKCADILRGLADLLTETEDAKASTEGPEKPVEAPAKESKASAAAASLAKEKPIAAKIARAGGTEQVKALIEKHGADKLSAVPPEQYGALLKELEGIGNGT